METPSRLVFSALSQQLEDPRATLTSLHESSRVLKIWAGSTKPQDHTAKQKTTAVDVKG